MNKRIWLLILVWLSVACQIEIGKSTAVVQRENCRDKLSESETLRALTGKWRLVATGCGDCFNPGPNKATEQIALTIYADQHIETFKENKLISSTGFRLSNSYNGGYFSIETIPKNQNQYTHGIIELCKNTLVFNSGYTDGAIYYFEPMH